MTSSPLILAIDSAMNGCSVALYQEGGVSISRSREMERGQAEELMPMVQAVMMESEFSYGNLDRVAVTVGPGTFTGLRIGLSAARALGLVLNIPVDGLSTLDVLAVQFQTQRPEPCTVLIETKRQDFYFQIFDAAGEPEGGAQALAADEIAERLAGRDTVLIGDAVKRFASVRPEFAGKITEIRLPDPLVMAKMAAAGRHVRTADPLYLRTPDTSQPKMPPRRVAGLEE